MMQPDGRFLQREEDESIWSPTLSMETSATTHLSELSCLQLRMKKISLGGRIGVNIWSSAYICATLAEKWASTINHVTYVYIYLNSLISLCIFNYLFINLHDIIWYDMIVGIRNVEISTNPYEIKIKMKIYLLIYYSLLHSLQISMDNINLIFISTNEYLIKSLN